MFCLKLGLAHLRSLGLLLDTELSDLLRLCFQVTFATAVAVVLRLLDRLGLCRHKLTGSHCLRLRLVSHNRCLKPFWVLGHHQLLMFLCVGLIHLVLDLSHTLCFFNTEPFPFLVPAPLVNLAFSQTCLLAELSDRFFAPVGVLVKPSLQVTQLVA